MLDAWLDLVTGTACVGCGRPGRTWCVECAHRLVARPVLARPRPCPEGLMPVVASAEYAGPVRALVVAHKEHAAYSLSRPLGLLLAASAGFLAAHSSSRSVVLVPVPSRGSVVRQRGHDPLLRLTREAAGQLRADGCPAQVSRLLAQDRRVADQAGLDAAARALNLSGSMRVSGSRRPGHSPVVICDDVVTTGATLREAQRVLEEAGVVVLGGACVAATRRRSGVGAARR